MIKQVFYIKRYWKVVVYYNVDYSLFDYILSDFKYAEISDTVIQDVYINMYNKKAKAVTCSNPEKHISIVLFNTHKTSKDYINSIVHEAEHIKQSILEEYYVEDSNELPAYTIGYIIEKMFRVFKDIICKM